ncbi:hypothetical protein TY91_11050 [Secundilactobacillus collinoides]|uniref:Uncharacterized protein n=1 Tax=Secundilactobacillus collinoides TaxID=33960 RepID=A0A166GH33_SECCO|nr:hypothetical protein TY91_11050 [Secundilactobacillus collinoides]
MATPCFLQFVFSRGQKCAKVPVVFASYVKATVLIRIWKFFSVGKRRLPGQALKISVISTAIKKSKTKIRQIQAVNLAQI